MNGQKFVPLGIAKVSVGATPVALAHGQPNDKVPDGATMATISVETAAIRYRDDGTAPAADTGVPLATGLAPYEYWGDLAALEMIAETGTASVTVAFYKAAG